MVEDIITETEHKNFCRVTFDMWIDARVCLRGCQAAPDIRGVSAADENELYVLGEVHTMCCVVGV